MAVVFPLVFLLIIISLVAGVVALVRHQQRQRYAAWLGVAQQTGLAFDGREISGKRHGQMVRAWTESRGSGKNRTTYTVIRARLAMPLDVGLNLRKHGFFNDMFHRSVDVVVGDPLFDDTFIVAGDEPHRVHALFGPKLRALILQQLGSDNRFSVTDHGVSVECVGASSSAAWLLWAIESTTQITAGLDLARPSVPVAGPLMYHREAWRAFAQASGLAGTDTPLCMWGQIEGCEVLAYAVRTDVCRYELEISLRFARPLGAGLELMAGGLLDKVAVFFGGEDHVFGDAPFDDAFRIKVAAAERAEELLDERARRELLALHREVGPVTLNDWQLTVRLKHVPQHPAIVPRTVRQMIGAAEMLGAKAAQLGVGPYR